MGLAKKDAIFMNCLPAARVTTTGHYRLSSGQFKTFFSFFFFFFLFFFFLFWKQGYEQTAEVIDGPQSVVFDQAENRMHVQNTLILNLPLPVVESKLPSQQHLEAPQKAPALAAPKNGRSPLELPEGDSFGKEFVAGVSKQQEKRATKEFVDAIQGRRRR